MNEYQPTIPAKVRDAAYIGGLIVTAVVGVATATIAAVAPEAAPAASQIGAAVLTATGLVVSGLGVAYRPGAQSNG